MADPVHLHGYRYSVYNRVARLALLSKNVKHETIEVNPFAELSEAYLMLHPFGRVPVLTHGAFKLFETSAITRYVDRAFKGRSLQPEGAAALARLVITPAAAFAATLVAAASTGLLLAFIVRTSPVTILIITHTTLVVLLLTPVSVVVCHNIKI